MVLTVYFHMQAGILAVGGTQEVVVLVGGKPVAKSQMKVTLSADQRVYDGATSSKFLQVYICS
jgi:pyruvate dehydrogenase E2 component (dihydrolipoamide acetyltransferase)